MKINFLNRVASRQGGHLLLSVLIITAVLSFVAIAYVKLTFTQNSFTVHSQVWNNCMPIVEAGVEDALGQLNYATNYNFAASGWTGTSTLFAKTKALGDGYYTVTVNFSNSLAPIITCTGYLPAPLTLVSAAHGSMTAAAFVPDPNIKYISRTVRVILKREAAFPQALVMKSGIDLNGNNILVDSFNSSVGIYTALTARDKGNVTLNAEVINVGNIGNANIKGTVSVGPKANVKIGPNGCVGSVAWHLSPGKGVQSGWLRKDSNVSFPDVIAPWTGGAVAPFVAGGNYTLDGGNFELNMLSIPSGKKMTVKSDSVLYVKGNIDIVGDIEVFDGVKLRVYCGGPNCSLLGTYTKKDIASEFLFYGLPSLKNITANGFAAGIYAPSATMTLTGKNQFYGSATVDSITMTGSSGFHYDEALSTLTGTGYKIDSWNEL